eukprot:TRINITY_DN6056_c1_g1_i1.p1 TRINITY_DN6056_c1_g1~~TRINITY_DN6056_c1_g1_i1.p1  ORF type:complete len:2690 (+),score=808.28 TRINITY_DN6056_c1_g1_i1:685-8070(+)
MYAADGAPRALDADIPQADDLSGKGLCVSFTKVAAYVGINTLIAVGTLESFNCRTQADNSSISVRPAGASNGAAAFDETWPIDITGLSSYVSGIDVHATVCGVRLKASASNTSQLSVTVPSHVASHCTGEGVELSVAALGETDATQSTDVWGVGVRERGVGALACLRSPCGPQCVADGECVEQGRALGIVARPTSSAGGSYTVGFVGISAVTVQWAVFAGTLSAPSEGQCSGAASRCASLPMQGTGFPKTVSIANGSSSLDFSSLELPEGMNSLCVAFCPATGCGSTQQLSYSGFGIYVSPRISHIAGRTSGVFVLPAHRTSRVSVKVPTGWATGAHLSIVAATDCPGVVASERSSETHVSFDGNMTEGFASLDASTIAQPQGLRLCAAVLAPGDLIATDRSRFVTRLDWEVVTTTMYLDGSDAATPGRSEMVLFWKGDLNPPSIALSELLLVNSLGTTLSAALYGGEMKFGFGGSACSGGGSQLSPTGVSCNSGTSRCSGTLAVPPALLSDALDAFKICVSCSTGVEMTALETEGAVISVDSVEGVSSGVFVMFQGVARTVTLSGDFLGHADGRLSLGFATANGFGDCPAKASSCAGAVQGWHATTSKKDSRTLQYTLSADDTQQPGNYCACVLLSRPGEAVHTTDAKWRHTGVGAVVIPISSLGATSGSILGAVAGASPPSAIIATVSSSAAGSVWLSVRAATTTEAAVSCDGESPWEPLLLSRLSTTLTQNAGAGSPAAAPAVTATRTHPTATETVTEPDVVGWRVPAGINATPDDSAHALCLSTSASGPWALLPHKLVVVNVTTGTMQSSTGTSMVSVSLRRNATVAVTGQGLSRVAPYFSVQRCPGAGTDGCCGGAVVDAGTPACVWGCDCAAQNGSAACGGLSTGGVSSEAQKPVVPTGTAAVWNVYGTAMAQVDTTGLGRFEVCVAVAALYGTCGTWSDTPPPLAFSSIGVTYEVVPEAVMSFVSDPAGVVDWQTGALPTQPEAAVVSASGAVLSSGALLGSTFVEAYWEPAVGSDVAWEHPASCASGLSIGCKGIPYKEEMVSDTVPFPHVSLLGRHGVTYRLVVSGSGVQSGASGNVTMGTCNSTSASEYALPFVKHTAACKACPDGITCDGSSTLLVLSGYWKPDNFSATAYECGFPYGADGCTAGGCKDEYNPTQYPYAVNPRCTICAEGYGKAIQNQCLQCGAKWSDGLLVAVGTLVFLVIVAVLVLTTLPSKHDAFGVLVKILLNHLSVSARVGDFSSSVGQLLQPLYEAQAQVAEVPTEFAAADCALGLSAYAKFGIVVTMPLSLTVLLGAFFGSWRLVRRFRGKSKPKRELRRVATQLNNRRRVSPSPLRPASAERAARAAAGSQKISPALPSAGQLCDGRSEGPLLVEQSPSALSRGLLVSGEERYAEHHMPASEAALPEQAADEPVPAPAPLSFSHGRSQAADDIGASTQPQSFSAIRSLRIDDDETERDDCTFGNTLKSEDMDMTVVKRQPHEMPPSGATTRTSSGPLVAPQQLQGGPSLASMVSADEGYDGDALVPRLFGVDTSRLWRLFAQTVVVILFLLYPTMLTECARMLHCETIMYYHPPESADYATYAHAVDAGTASDAQRYYSVSYLIADPRVRCEGTEYGSYRRWALILFVCYGVGIPVGIMVFVRVLSARLGRKRAYQMFSFFISGYRTGNVHGTITSRWWWEVVPMFRKMVMVCIVVFLGGRGGQSEQMLGTYVALLAMLGFLTAQIIGQPFHTPHLNLLETVSLFTIVLTLTLSLLYVYVRPEDSDGLGLLDPDAPEEWRRNLFVICTLFLAILNGTVTLVLVVCIVVEGRQKLRDFIREKQDLISDHLHVLPDSVRRCVLRLVRMKCLGAEVEETAGSRAALLVSDMDDPDDGVGVRVVPAPEEWDAPDGPSGPREWFFVRAAPAKGFARWELRESDSEVVVHYVDDGSAPMTDVDSCGAVWWARRVDIPDGDTAPDGEDGETTVVAWSRAGSVFIGTGRPPGEDWEPKAAFTSLSASEREDAAREGRWRVRVQEREGQSAGAAYAAQLGGRKEFEVPDDWSDEDDPDAPEHGPEEAELYFQKVGAERGLNYYLRHGVAGWQLRVVAEQLKRYAVCLEEALSSAEHDGAQNRTLLEDRESALQGLERALEEAAAESLHARQERSKLTAECDALLQSLESAGVRQEGLEAALQEKEREAREETGASSERAPTDVAAELAALRIQRMAQQDEAHRLRDRLSRVTRILRATEQDQADATERADALKAELRLANAKIGLRRTGTAEMHRRLMEQAEFEYGSALEQMSAEDERQKAILQRKIEEKKKKRERHNWFGRYTPEPLSEAELVPRMMSLRSVAARKMSPLSASSSPVIPHLGSTVGELTSPSRHGTGLSPRRPVPNLTLQRIPTMPGVPLGATPLQRHGTATGGFSSLLIADASLRSPRLRQRNSRNLRPGDGSSQMDASSRGSRREGLS